MHIWTEDKYFFLLQTLIWRDNEEKILPITEMKDDDMVKGKIHQGVKNRLKMALDLKLVFRYALDKDLNKA